MSSNSHQGWSHVLVLAIMGYGVFRPWHASAKPPVSLPCRCYLGAWTLFLLWLVAGLKRQSSWFLLSGCLCTTVLGWLVCLWLMSGCLCTTVLVWLACFWTGAGSWLLRLRARGAVTPGGSRIWNSRMMGGQGGGQGPPRGSTTSCGQPPGTAWGRTVTAMILQALAIYALQYFET